MTWNHCKINIWSQNHFYSSNSGNKQASALVRHLPAQFVPLRTGDTFSVAFLIVLLTIIGVGAA